MDVPQDYKNAGVFMIISGALNMLTSIGIILALIWVCVGAAWFVTLGLGVVELVMGVALMSGERKHSAKSVATLGVVNSVLCCNIVGLILQALSVSFLSKPEVRAYLDER